MIMSRLGDECSEQLVELHYSVEVNMQSHLLGFMQFSCFYQNLYFFR